MNNDVVLGAKYKDKITGFSGVVTGITEYISGCSQALLVPLSKEDGTFVEGNWFDFQRLERLDDSLITLDNTETPGCDKVAPKR